MTPPDDHDDPEIARLKAENEQLRIQKAAVERAFMDVLDALKANSTTAPVLAFIRAKLGVRGRVELERE